MASKGIVGWTDVDLSPEGQAEAGLKVMMVMMVWLHFVLEISKEF